MLFPSVFGLRSAAAAVSATGPGHTQQRTSQRAASGKRSRGPGVLAGLLPFLSATFPGRLVFVVPVMSRAFVDLSGRNRKRLSSPGSQKGKSRLLCFEDESRGAWLLVGTAASEGRLLPRKEAGVEGPSGGCGGRGGPQGPQGVVWGYGWHFVVRVGAPVLGQCAGISSHSLL